MCECKAGKNLVKFF